jgi:putative ABC transport system permease protein
MALLGKTPLARKNLTHNVRRLAVALAGIGFAVVLMFMQMGFRDALFYSTVKIVTDMDADMLLVNRARYTLPARQSFDFKRILQARSCPGVAAVYPMYTESFGTEWRPDGGGKPYSIRVIAFDPDDPIFLIPEVRAQTSALRRPDVALIDSRSKNEYGIPTTLTLLRKQTGAELASHAIRLAGTFPMGTDFANDGNLIMSSANLARFFPMRALGADPLSNVDLGIVKIQEDADIRAVQRELRRRFGGTELSVFLKSQLIDREIGFWDRSTPIGYIFSVGTIMGFVVGTIICYQIIYADIADHMPEFATLKAMGYRNRFFISLVLQMSAYLSIIGYLPGLVVSWAMYQALAHGTGLLLEMKLPQALLVFGLTLGMCMVSGCMAMRKLLEADPAELF